MSSPPDPAAILKTWTIQTIAAAMSLRADATGKQATQESFEAAQVEAQAIGLDLWNEAFADTGRDVPAQVTMMKVSGKVFDWCHTHMHPED
jgi:hypothetical protein